jgi:hypothetical protein
MRNSRHFRGSIRLGCGGARPPLGSLFFCRAAQKTKIENRFRENITWYLKTWSHRLDQIHTDFKQKMAEKSSSASGNNASKVIHDKVQENGESLVKILAELALIKESVNGIKSQLAAAPARARSSGSRSSSSTTAAPGSATIFPKNRLAWLRTAWIADRANIESMFDEDQLAELTKFMSASENSKLEGVEFQDKEIGFLWDKFGKSSNEFKDELQARFDKAKTDYESAQNDVAKKESEDAEEITPKAAEKPKRAKKASPK